MCIDININVCEVIRSKMCGIFAYLFSDTQKRINRSSILTNAIFSQHRGPDNTTIKMSDPNHIFVFHRLCINDQSNMGNQPMNHGDFTLICNGEIYNHLELQKNYDLQCASKSDCEVIIHMCAKFGIERTVRELDGVFAFVLYNKKEQVYHIARDPVGVRSLYIGRTTDGDTVCSSELKSIHSLSKEIQLFPPGSFCTIPVNNVGPIEYEQFYNYVYPLCNHSEEKQAKTVLDLLIKAVKKRMMSDREIGCFLSGGLDSSIVTALVASCMPDNDPSKLHTFSIGMEGSTDILAARAVANHVGTTHHEIIVTKEEMIAALPEVVRQIESYDTTTVRASTPMYLLSKWIKQNTNIAVIFSGEGSDELSGSYLYFHNAPSPEAFQEESIRLVKDLHYFDVLRCDKSTAGAGLEVRVPFLDKEFVQAYMSVPPSIRMPRKKIEKYFLRKICEDYLPESIVWRTKEAFSDGVSSVSDSWYSIIQNFVETKMSDSKFLLCKTMNKVNPPQSKESAYYRVLFEKNYPGCSGTIPYYWLPKWSGDVTDPSARVLESLYGDGVTI